MIVAAHQPNFMPWLGYFDKMRRADLFVSVDHVQMERQGFQNRTTIKTGEGPRWITVPVVQGSREDTIAGKLIDNSRTGRFRWGRKMFLTIKYAYQAAPHFAERADALERILEARWERLSDLNHKLIDFTREALGVRTPVVRSSDLKIRGAKSDMVLAICREVGADTYLSGAGASRTYLDVGAFERAGVRVVFQDFVPPRYVQQPDPSSFLERVSALDLVFNCGPRAGDVLTGAAPAPAAAGDAVAA